MIDFHTHLLPGIDDGSSDKEETMQIVHHHYKAGVKTFVVTPHFYPDQEVEVFVEAREEAKLIVEAALREEGLEDVKLYKGAEVLLSVDTWQLENLASLCIEGTPYILLEMPYSYWSDWVYTSVQKIIDHHKLIPIIAHVERYEMVAQNPNCLLPFIEMGALLQVNAYSMHKKSSRRRLVKRLLKHNVLHLLGSDVHQSGNGMTVADGYQFIKKVKGKKAPEKCAAIAQQVLEGQEVDLAPVKRFRKILGRWY